MKNNITSFKKNYIVCVIILLFSCSYSYSQAIIANQGFDSSVQDDWNYVNTLNTGYVDIVNTFSASTPNSLRFRGSNGSGSGPSNNDPETTFNNLDLTGYTNNFLSINFSSDGSPDDNDDLYLDYSYNNGVSYTTVKLIDGRAYTPDNLPFTHAPVAGISVGSHYILNIPNGNTQIKIRIRFDERDNTSNTSDYYFIDNVKVYGTKVGTSLTVEGLNNVTVPHNSLSNDFNGTNFNETQVLVEPVDKTFTIKNIGTNTINLTGAPLVNIIGSPDFTVITMPTTPINSPGNTTFQIRFNPSSIGTKTATVSIASNDSDENPYLFEIKGIGIEAFFDSDGDGITDNIDIDDDNDGLIDVTEEQNCVNSNGPKVNYKFLNETFGSGGRTTINTTYDAFTSYCFEDGSVGEPYNPQCPDLYSPDLNDGKYTVGQSAQIASWAATQWYAGPDHTGNPNGRMAIFNASYSPGIFYTATITGALPTLPITYSFWVINLMKTTANNIAAHIKPNIRVEFRDMNDNLITSIVTGDVEVTNAANPLGDWYQFTSNVSLNTSAFKVIFINNNPGGLGNDLAIDDIIISQTLCDIDNDGVADIYDLDSDNDGIPDIVENGLGNLSNGEAKMNTASWVDANSNGLHDSAESLGGTLDFDGDGIPNYIDLDSDNDTFFDVDESWANNINAYTGYENGDGDITGDGVGDGPETETFRLKDTNGDGVNEGFGDGILDIYDYNFNFYGNLNQGSNIAPFNNYVKDTDGDGAPDYLDVTSNGINYDISLGLYANLDSNNDGIIDDNTDTDSDGIVDLFDTNDALFGSPRDLERKLLIDFDGRNDYATDSNLTNNLNNASLMAWININNLLIDEAVIVGQNNFQLKINTSKNLQAIVKNTTLTSPTVLNSSQWIHVAVTYNVGTSEANLFINGNIVATTSVSGGLGSDMSVFTIAKNPISDTNFFKGKIDEVRLFNTALSIDELRKMIYQEIKDNAGVVAGEIIPKEITSLPWTNLMCYFRMDNYKNDIIDNHTSATIDVGAGAKIFNVKTINIQQAPMPFITEQTGNFAVATNSISKQIRGLDASENDWSIIQVNHNIISYTNHIDLGLFVAPGVLIEMNNHTKIQNDWYLKLDGTIDLQGRSQLIQTIESDLDPLSIGKVERDQQGTGNLFNYNYWSSPVSSENTTTLNNGGYSLTNILKDGTNPINPQTITWIGGYNGNNSPVQIARYWLYKFTNLTNEYANWQQINENSIIMAGQGYTMKGTGIAAPSSINNQNYVFVGKPNNGIINHSGLQVIANNLNLIGNPYPSAIDANSLILDNLTSTNGSIYFWEHAVNNNTHNLSGYTGGYAIRNLVGGVAPIAPELISGVGNSSKVPGRFIPVAQGFYMKGNNTGGQITFNNSQRIFIKEDNINSNELFKNDSNEQNLDNSEDPYYVNNEHATIRIGFKGNSNLKRELLVGFMNENANFDINPGYDANIIDIQPTDFYFETNNSKLAIQGLGYYNNNMMIPLTFNIANQGNYQIKVMETENFVDRYNIHLFDSLNNLYYNISEETQIIELNPGEIKNRFFIVFNNENVYEKEELTVNQSVIFYNNNKQLITIINNDDIAINQVTIFSINGQLINTWNTLNDNQKNIELNTKKLSTGVYLIQTKKTNGTVNSQKIVVK
ncbi:choice-of-anchor D domain-containing protein [Flavobacterium sp. LMO8]|uniref:LamG-like jellyroll fold domain-containing protein n=1 Tax=Flavobacterium sp. LMO8 TaxID=2654244 RepID=UPI0012928A9F|nr:LamG-like jellyroll fold domain-containing protein [Flavobacterium sp. LMO8]MQP25648.1 choice-of-anchor D domain-containing protein [Flavobacterium sp. LMO8]